MTHASNVMEAAWLIAGLLVVLVLSAIALAVLNGRRFAREVTRDFAVLLTTSTPARASGALPRSWPEPVRTYLTLALGESPPDVRSVHLIMSGDFRTKLDGDWKPIRGEQVITASPPSFVWWGRLRMGAGLWADALDRSIEGVGRMQVSLASTITLVDRVGADLDQSAQLRLLGELAWIPSVLADQRYVSWTPIDEHHARAILTVGGPPVEAVFEMGHDGLPVSFTAPRYRDLGGGRSELTPFVGTYADYRRVEGTLVPHQVTAAWEVDGRPQTFARFRVESYRSASDVQRGLRPQRPSSVPPRSR